MDLLLGGTNHLCQRHVGASCRARVPTRYPPSVSLEELDADGVVLRIVATPLRPEEGSKLADEVLAALREVGAPQLA